MTTTTSKRTAVWLDDLRNPKDYQHLINLSGANDVRWCQTVEEFRTELKALLDSQVDFVNRVQPELREKNVQLVGLYFDNDLGNELPGHEGRDAFNWFEELCHDYPNIPPCFLYCQSSNPAARKSIEQGFSSLYRFWAREPQS